MATAKRENGTITVTINEKDLLDGLKLPLYGYYVTVTDAERFLERIASSICSIGDAGDFNSRPMLDSLIELTIAEAAEEGAGCVYGEYDGHQT